MLANDTNLCLSHKNMRKIDQKKFMRKIKRWEKVREKDDIPLKIPFSSTKFLRALID